MAFIVRVPALHSLRSLVGLHSCGVDDDVDGGHTFGSSSSVAAG